MKTAEVCSRDVVAILRGTPLTEAARLMREKHVGSVVVLERAGSRKPVGIVTDRDIVVEVVAARLDPDTVTVGDIMGTSLVTASEDDGLLETIKTMRGRAVRRLPVVDAEGNLSGIVSLDDLLQIAGEALADVAGTVVSERSVESFRRP